MRKEVRQLVSLGPLPDEQTAELEQLKEYEQWLYQVTSPVSDEEARALIGLFGPDDCYGLAWTLLHLVETAPGWPLQDCLETTRGVWGEELRRRVDNARRFGLLD